MYENGSNYATCKRNIYFLAFYFYQRTRLPVTRWVKLSLNFELLVPK